MRRGLAPGFSGRAPRAAEPAREVDTGALMTSFRDDDQTYQRVDYRLLQNGAVTLYCRRAYLEEDIAWLVARGYRLHRWDTSKWRSEAEMHAAIATELAFPDHYRRTLDDFYDCLCDLDIPPDAGLALVLDRFASFARQRRGVAEAILDIAQDVSRQYVLFGHRFLVLVQSDDPQIEFEPLGAVPANWNHREWSKKSRDPNLNGRGDR